MNNKIILCRLSSQHDEVTPSHIHLTPNSKSWSRSSTASGSLHYSSDQPYFRHKQNFASAVPGEDSSGCHP